LGGPQINPVCILAALAGRSKTVLWEDAVVGMNGRPPLWGDFPIAAVIFYKVIWHLVLLKQSPDGY